MKARPTRRRSCPPSRATSSALRREGGRRDLELLRPPGEVPLREWGREILAECAPVAAALDAASGGDAHRNAHASAIAMLADPAATPSARVLSAMARDHGNSHVRFVLAQSIAHRKSVLEMPLSGAVAERFSKLADESVDEQKSIEAADTLPFEAYRQLYLAPFRLHE